MIVKKNYLIVIAIQFIFSLSLNGQKYKLPNFPFDDSGQVKYEEVVKVDSVYSKEDLFIAAREWFAIVYPSAKKTLQMDDKESGKLIGKVSLPVQMNSIINTKYPGGFIDYTIALYFKNGRYKYVISDIFHRGITYDNVTVPSGGSIPEMIARKKGYLGNSYKKTFLYFMMQFDEHIQKLILNLKVTLSKPVIEEDDDW